MLRKDNSKKEKSCIRFQAAIKAKGSAQRGYSNFLCRKIFCLRRQYNFSKHSSEIVCADKYIVCADNIIFLRIRQKLYAQLYILFATYN
jgi:hypothetical protein